MKEIDIIFALLGDHLESPPLFSVHAIGTTAALNIDSRVIVIVDDGDDGQDRIATLFPDYKDLANLTVKTVRNYCNSCEEGVEKHLAALNEMYGNEHEYVKYAKRVLSAVSRLHGIALSTAKVYRDAPPLEKTKMCNGMEVYNCLWSLRLLSFLSLTTEEKTIAFVDANCAILSAKDMIRSEHGCSISPAISLPIAKTGERFSCYDDSWIASNGLYFCAMKGSHEKVGTYSSDQYFLFDLVDQKIWGLPDVNQPMFSRNFYNATSSFFFRLFMLKTCGTKIYTSSDRSASFDVETYKYRISKPDNACYNLEDTYSGIELQLNNHKGNISCLDLNLGLERFGIKEVSLLHNTYSSPMNKLRFHISNSDLLSYLVPTKAITQSGVTLSDLRRNNYPQKPSALIRAFVNAYSVLSNPAVIESINRVICSNNPSDKDQTIHRLWCFSKDIITDVFSSSIKINREDYRITMQAMGQLLGNIECPSCISAIYKEIAHGFDADLKLSLPQNNHNSVDQLSSLISECQVHAPSDEIRCQK